MFHWLGKSMNVQDVSVHELRSSIALRDSSIAVIDVRTKEEYDEGHIENAIFIPHTEIGNHIKELNRFSKAYLYCRSGNRSQRACRNLSLAGLKNVYNVKGGVLDWMKRGFPLEKK